MVLADTDVLIDFLNGCQPVADRVEDLIKKRQLSMPAPVLFQLRAGVAGKRRLAVIEKLDRAIPVVPVARAEAVMASDLYTMLKRRGQLIDNFDLHIAATALLKDLPLLTRNRKHFERIPGLRLF